MVYKIAILATKIGDAHKEIINWFKKCFFKHPDTQKKCEIEIFEVYGADPSLIERTVRSIIAQEFDLIIPIGSRCATAAKKEVKKRRYRIPILFTGLSYPIENGLIQSLDKKDDAHSSAKCITWG